MASPVVEVFTVGGGEYIVNVFNAVAAWMGGGGFRGLVRVVMVMAFAMALMGMAWNMDPRFLVRWFMQSTLMYMVLMVPTVTVKVTDRTNPGLAPATIDNVPIGLAGMAGFTSQIGDYLTTSSETIFVMPTSLNYSTGGMVYGAKLLDAAQGLRIDDPLLATNLNEHFKQCVFYDVLLGRKTIESIVGAPDMLAAIGPGSVSLSQQYVNSGGSTIIMPCQSAYSLISIQWRNYYNRALPHIAQQFFPDVAAGTAQNKYTNDLAGIGSAGFGGTTSAELLTRQAMFVNALMQARDSFGSTSAQGAVDAFAVTRADIQTRNTYSTIAAGAMKWVPLLNIVLTVVFYAMFPLIFLLSLMPQSGIGVIKGYITGFFYLASWGPLFVVLNMIFMTRWQHSLGAWGAGGLTAANFAGVSSVNQDAGALAGYMIMSVPFIAAQMARGAMSIASHSTSFLAPSQNAAEQAASEQTTGNYSYGVRQLNTLSANQWNDAPNWSTGASQVVSRGEDGVLTKFNADGSQTHDVSGAMSNLAISPRMTNAFSAARSQALSEGQSVVEANRRSAHEAWSTTQSASERLFNTVEARASSNTEEGRSLNNALTAVDEKARDFSQTLQRDFGFNSQVADTLGRQAARTGKFDLDSALQVSGGGAGVGFAGQAGAAMGWQTSQNRDSRDEQRAEENLRNGTAWREKEANSESARQTRDSFYRQTSSSSDSQVRGLGQEASQDLRHAQTLSQEASRSEENYKRLSSELSNSESAGFSWDRNLSNEFDRFATQALSDPANRNLDQSYRPWLTSLNGSQAQTEGYLMKKFADTKMHQRMADFGLIPDKLGTELTGPSFSTVDDIKTNAAAGMADLARRGPAVNPNGPGGDPAIDGEVAGKLGQGKADLDAKGAMMKGVVIGEGGARADQLRRTVEDRERASLWQTMPGFGGNMATSGELGQGKSWQSGRGMSDAQHGPTSPGGVSEPVNATLPARAAGLRTYGRDKGGANQVGTSSAISNVLALAAGWSATGHAPISVGDISRAGGGPMEGHQAHQHGGDFDIRPWRKDGRNAGVTWRDAAYDRDATRQFVLHARQHNPGATILFNDPELIREGLVQPYKGHDNHLHLKLGAKR